MKYDSESEPIKKSVVVVGISLRAWKLVLSNFNIL